MKGIIQTQLTLGLLLSLTGIVNGQQFAPDDRAFGGGNATRPTPDQGIFAPGGSAGNGAEDFGRELSAKQFVLQLDANLIQEFRLKGELSASIDPIVRSKVNEIIFGFKQPLDQSTTSNNYEQIQLFGTENNALVFEFSESDLRAVETRTLRYRIDPQQVGQFTAVVIRLRGVDPKSMAPSDLSPLPPNHDRLAAGMGNSGNINPPSSNPGFLDKPLGNPGLNPLDRSAPEGSTNPALDRGRDRSSGSLLDRENSQPAPMPNRFADRGGQSGLGPVSGLAREPEMKSWRTESPVLNRDAAITQDAAAIQQRSEYLARINQDLNNKEADLQYRERLLLEKEKAIKAEQERTANWDSNLASRRSEADSRLASLNPNVNSTTSPNTYPDRRDDPALLELKSTILTGFNNVSQSFQSLSNRVEAMELESQRTLADRYAAQSNASAVPNPLPNRTDRNYTPSLENFQAGISGTSDKTTTLNPNLQGPLYFMLLCSLGLNIYLGLVSRNFYVRYNELADELRETFSASISS